MLKMSAFVLPKYKLVEPKKDEGEDKKSEGAINDIRWLNSCVKSTLNSPTRLVKFMGNFTTV